MYESSMSEQLLKPLNDELVSLKYLLGESSQPPSEVYAQAEASLVRLKARADDLLRALSIWKSEEEEKARAVEVPTASISLNEGFPLAARFKATISLNDSFRFTRELFGGDAERMNRVFDAFSTLADGAAAEAFLLDNLREGYSPEVLDELLELMSKYYNRPRIKQ